MARIDYSEKMPHLYQPSEETVSVVEVPPMNFLMVDGAGDPGATREFPEAIEALMVVSHVLKILIRKGESGVDYRVLPLEGLWWSDENGGFVRERRDDWKWTLMIMQPDEVTPELYEIAVAEAERQKNPPGLTRLRFDSYFEGLSAQIMHAGLQAQEGPTIARLHAYIEGEGYIRQYKHHEIYLSDVRKEESGRWRTIIRQPVRRG